MSPDEQEAGSRRYGDDVILILPLSSGRIAVFNNARELCSIVEDSEDIYAKQTWDRIKDAFFPPKKKPPSDFTLEDLGL